MCWVKTVNILQEKYLTVAARALFVTNAAADADLSYAVMEQMVQVKKRGDKKLYWHLKVFYRLCPTHRDLLTSIRVICIFLYKSPSGQD